MSYDSCRSNLLCEVMQGPDRRDFNLQTKHLCVPGEDTGVTVQALGTGARLHLDDLVHVEQPGNLQMRETKRRPLFV
jgi:hypothetical protein